MEKVCDTLATVDNWDDVYSFLDHSIKGMGLGKKIHANVMVACEEIFVNVSNYAYRHLKTPGKVRIKFLYDGGSGEMTITFIDEGKPFDPTKFKKADVTSPVEERKIGGLGIFLVKQIMDKVEYEYFQNKNVLKLTKKL